MSPSTSVSVFLYADNNLTQSYKPGSFTVFGGGITIHLMEDDPIPQLEQLRDECQRQIEAHQKSRLDFSEEPHIAQVEVAPPAEVEPLETVIVSDISDDDTPF